MTYGAGGIPREGFEAEYAEQLWLDGPSAFWLHPEGPLSETTPDEWRVKSEAAREARDAERKKIAKIAQEKAFLSIINGMNDVATIARGRGIVWPHRVSKGNSYQNAAMQQGIGTQTINQLWKL